MIRATLSLLYGQDAQLLDPNWFLCPATADQQTVDRTLSPRTCSYLGRDPAWGALTSSSDSDTRVAADDGFDHHGDGCNVLFLDGHVEFITADGDPTGPPLSATDE